MQSRTFLRIEGDLVSLVTRGHRPGGDPPGPPDRAHHAQVAMTPRLPTGCRFWIRSGTTDRSVFVVEQPPSRRTIEYHASRRHDSEPATYRLALPYVVFVVSTIGDQIEGLSTYFRTAADRVARRDAPLLHPAEHERRRRRLPRIGPGERGERRRAGRRPDRRVLGEPLQPGPPSAPAAVQRWLPGLGVPLPARSARGPVAAYDPYWRTLRQVVAQMAGTGGHGSAGRDTRSRMPQTEAEVLTPEPGRGRR